MFPTLLIIAISVLACANHRPRHRQRKKEWDPSENWSSTRTIPPENCNVCGSPFVGPPYLHKSRVDGHETWMWHHPKVRMQPGCPSAAGCTVPEPKEEMA